MFFRLFSFRVFNVGFFFGFTYFWFWMLSAWDVFGLGLFQVLEVLGVGGFSFDDSL